MKRNRNVDILKGILIILVVIGHSRGDCVHDIIFLFHMPLFFIVSGLFYHEDTTLNKEYICKCLRRYILPYFAYMVLFLLFLNDEYSIKELLKVLYGGRLAVGVWWYITCLFGALIGFTWIRTTFKSRITVIAMLTCGGVLAVIEANILEYVPLLDSPGIPWSLDTSLLAMVYIAIGYYNKDKILKLLDRNKRYDLTACAILICLAVFCYFNYRGESFYYFDMKHVYYKELISAIMVPVLFGFVLCRIVYWVDKVEIAGKILGQLGRMTIPVMYLHVPLNGRLQEFLGYGSIVYIAVGIGIPVLCSLILYRFSLMRKLFGLPNLKEKT
ncbi:MAG: acyltransferase family protein [Oscillospiraceae bacterium]|nr:acyltransferase family protein [Oscillospiraceae bacterium]